MKSAFLFLILCCIGIIHAMENNENQSISNVCTPKNEKLSVIVWPNHQDSVTEKYLFKDVLGKLDYEQVCTVINTVRAQKKAVDILKSIYSSGNTFNEFRWLKALMVRVESIPKSAYDAGVLKFINQEQCMMEEKVALVENEQKQFDIPGMRYDTVNDDCYFKRVERKDIKRKNVVANTNE